MGQGIIAPVWGTTWTGKLSVRGTAGQYATFPVESTRVQEMVMDAFNAFVDAVTAIPSVEQVRGQVAGAYLHLVAYVSESSVEERFAVYAVEQQMYDRFPDLRLEFDLIDRKGYPVTAGELTGKYVAVIRTLPDRADGDELS